MSEFDYDVFGSDDIEEVPKKAEEPKKVVKTEAAKEVKKVETKKVKTVKPKPTEKPEYDVFDSVESEAKTESKEATKAQTEEQYDVFSGGDKAAKDTGYYDAADGGYQDEGGSGNRRGKTIQTGEAAGLAVAAVAGAALSKSNKVPKAVKNAINPNYQNEKKRAEEQQFLNARKARQANYEKRARMATQGPKKPFYKKWWFWLILGLLVLGIAVGSCGGDGDSSKETTTVSESTTTTTETTTTTTEASTVAKVYSVPSGAKVEKINEKWGLYKDGQLVEGYTGIASNNHGDWYIENGLVNFNKNGIVKDGSQEYQVSNGKAVKYSDGTTEAPKLSEGEYKARCKKVSYTELARNPDNYKGQYVRFYGQVLQVQTQSFMGVDLGSVVLRVATKDSGYGNYYDDVVYVTYTKKEGEGNILEDDFITFYGEYKGTESYTTVLGAEVTIPAVDAEYVDIQ